MIKRKALRSKMKKKKVKVNCICLNLSYLKTHQLLSMKKEKRKKMNTVMTKHRWTSL